MTLGDIRSRGLKRLDDDVTTPVAYSESEATAAINMGLQEYAFLTLSLENQATLALTPGTWSYRPLDYFADWILPLRVTLAATGAKIRPAGLRDLDALDRGWQGSRAVPKRYVSEGWNLLGFYGTGSAVQVTYACAAPELFNDSDVPAILENDHPLLVEFMLYVLYLKSGAQMLTKGLACYARFLEGATARASDVRARAVERGYDPPPIELARFDLSRVVGIAKAKTKGGTWPAAG